jgi:hypothetical protein
MKQRKRFDEGKPPKVIFLLIIHINIVNTKVRFVHNFHVGWFKGSSHKNDLRGLDLLGEEETTNHTLKGRELHFHLHCASWERIEEKRSIQLSSS